MDGSCTLVLGARLGLLILAGAIHPCYRVAPRWLSFTLAPSTSASCCSLGAFYLHLQAALAGVAPDRAREAQTRDHVIDHYGALCRSRSRVVSRVLLR